MSASSVKLNIGALARATGVPANTLRTWERRYGFPVASRTEGGQRLYDPEMVDRVRAVARAIDRGFRPANVIQASTDELNAMVADVVPAPTPPRRTAPSGDIPSWVDAATALDGAALEQAFRNVVARQGLAAFVDDYAVPFLRQVGLAWEHGRLDPFQEHFASETLRDFLSGEWRRMAEANHGPIVALAGLPGDHHVLALHMAACHAAMAGWRVVYLGADTPLGDIETCARREGVGAVVISISAPGARPDTAWNLAALRQRVPAAVHIVVGGAGAPDGVEGVTRLPDLGAFARWLEERRER